MNAATLYAKHDQAALLALARQVEADPANRNPAGSVAIFTPAASRKLGAIAHAIAMHQADRRAAAGQPVPTSGYSGRQTNRRR